MISHRKTIIKSYRSLKNKTLYTYQTGNSNVFVVQIWINEKKYIAVDSVLFKIGSDIKNIININLRQILENLLYCVVVSVNIIWKKKKKNE